MSKKIFGNKAISKLQAVLLIVAIVVVAVAAGITYNLMLPKSSSNDSFTITDYAGRTLTFNSSTITSIASNYPISTEAILFLGGEQKLIGCDGSNYVNSFMKNLYPKISNATNIGYTWNLNKEQVVALAPSVLITAGNCKTDADTLTSLGVPTVCLSFETPQDFNFALTVIGKLLNKTDLANSAVQYYTSMVQSVTNKTQNLADNSKPSVLFVSYGAQKKYALQTPGQGMLQNNLINMSGGISVSASQASGWNQISMDQVALWNPDIVIVTSYATNLTSTNLKNQIMSDDTWNVTDAKLNGKIYAFAQDWGSWDAPTPKWILGFYWLSKFIQPSLFASTNLTEIASSFYQTYYNISFAQAGVIGDL